jgi:hypothetical protein
VAQGRGAVLDGPLQALAHFAGELQKRGTRLAAGDVITTGTLTDAQPLRPGQRWQSCLDGVPLPGLALAERLIQNDSWPWCGQTCGPTMRGSSMARPTRCRRWPRPRAHSGRHHVLAVCAGSARPPVRRRAEPQRHGDQRAVRKHALGAPADPAIVSVGVMGVTGDEQVDQTVHPAGRDQAVYVYPVVALRVLGRSAAPGRPRRTAGRRGGRRRTCW